MRWLPLFAVVALVASICPADAQADFGGLPLHAGDVVYVTEPSGREVGGKVTELSPMRLSVDGYAFTPERGLTIDRPGDSVLNGALIGSAFGAAAAAALYGETCAGRRETCSPRGVQMIGGAVVYAGIGALIDRLHVGKHRIFRGTGPSISSSSKGIGFAIGF